MRDKPVRLSLTQKVEEAETALEANLVRGASATDLRSHDRMLQTLDRLLERFPPSERPSWMLPLFVGAVAVSLLGLAALIRLPRPLVTVDTRISSIGVTAAADGDGLNSDAAFAVKSLEVAGDAKAQAIAKPAISISSFRLTPGTSAVMQQRASCVYVELPVAQVPAQPRMALGLDLVVLHAAGDGAELPVPSQLRAKPGTTVTICGDFPANYALAGSVEKDDLYRSQPGDALRGFVNLRTPSIISGKLRLPNVNRSSDLHDTDMLSLSGVTQGWAFVFPAAPMRVVFSGTVARPTSLSPSPEGGTDSLEPTALEWFTKSPFSTAVFGLVTGFVGMLWALGKYFGFTSR